ncbi:hypothetical protein HFN78_24615 [Rhizobium laguerreae]|uniref:hypothetical protein n=1 Tax=Rhizobium laguerreae TaxID=1076926 RepID=UPI001C90CD49|nr:hypothetical protein [Rhizobium laguerreae]MBY3474071.1 hypothetical protein [Rhizobium laguerreae]MBY3521864.1 hypothetical protein [Rhizobium laguerreae]
MKLLEAITSIKNAIDASAAAKSDSAWQAAVSAAGLVLEDGGRHGGLSIDEDYVATFGPLEVRVKHTMRDTSKAFAVGPDRTRVRLDLIHDGKVLDCYTNGYED